MFDKNNCNRKLSHAIIFQIKINGTSGIAFGFPKFILKHSIKSFYTKLIPQFLDRKILM